MREFRQTDAFEIHENKTSVYCVSTSWVKKGPDHRVLLVSNCIKVGAYCCQQLTILHDI